MKKITTLTASIILLCTVAATAQLSNVGIGTNTPNTSARLDITATDKGLLIPRVNLISLTDAVTVPVPATGLLVFNTNVSVIGGAGFYYNNGTAAAPSWLKLQTGGGGSGWGLTGNAGTDSTINFLGTTDNRPLVFGVNNGFAGQIGSNGGISLGRAANGIFRNTAPGVIAIGDSALYNNEDSSEIAIGNLALFNNTISGENIAIGNLSMFTNGTGFRNVALGHLSLASNDTGYYNTGIGFGSLNVNVSSHNTAVGAFSLVNSSTGDINTAVGFQALASNTGGFANTSVGMNSLRENTIGIYNTAVGWQSLFSNVNGVRNTAVGINALVNSTSGSFNVAIGRSALINNLTGSGNTALGNKALGTLIRGNFNTAIGDSADVFLDTTGVSNTTAIGYQAQAIANNTIVLGNTAIISIKGQVGFSTFSDGRYKKDVTENVKGLDFIMQLRPVTYHYNFDKIRAERYNKPADNSEEIVKPFTVANRQLKFVKSVNRPVTFSGGNNKIAVSNIANPALTDYYEQVKQNDQIRYTGFIAQEVEAAATKAGFEFSGVDKPKNNNDQYALRYAEFVVPLVKAVQEQQATIKTLNEKIEALTKRLDMIAQQK